MTAVPPNGTTKRPNNGALRRAAYPDVALLKAQQKRVGRPSPYNARTFDMILDLVAKGGQITKICDGKPPFPDYGTWFRWLAKSEELRQLYARARHMLVERYGDEIVLIADGKLPTEYDEFPDVQRDRLRIDARRWVMGKINPSFWGDKVPAIPAPTETEDERTIIDVRSLNPATRAALKAALVAIEEAERNGER